MAGDGRASREGGAMTQPCLHCGYWPGHGVIEFMAREVSVRWNWWAFQQRVQEARDAIANGAVFVHGVKSKEDLESLVV